MLVFHKSNGIFGLDDYPRVFCQKINNMECYQRKQLKTIGGMKVDQEVCVTIRHNQSYKKVLQHQKKKYNCNTNFTKIRAQK
jgi:hypothetical protein